MTDTPTTTTPAERSFRHTVKREAGARVVLEVEADADRLTRQTDRVFERHNQKARISGFRPGKAPRAMYERSEEHTSELQSRVDLVCRLLLEKKKIERRHGMSEKCRHG